MPGHVSTTRCTIKPIDPRLLRQARSARAFLALSVLIGVLQVGCVLVFSWAVAQAVAGMLMAHATWSESLGLVTLAAAAQGLRALLAHGWNTSSAVAAARVKRELRERLARHLRRLGPGWLAGRSSAQLATVYGRGLDALDGYFSRFLPQLVLTAIAVPVYLVVLWCEDRASGIIVAVTLPLIPVFMILIGWYTQRVQQAEWDVSRALAGHFVDVVRGLGTLKVFGRQWHQRDVITGVTDAYRVRTMRVLAVSFMSGFVLELAATLAVALVAVSIGTRLISGQTDLYTGLFVLLIAPEAFAPMRLVGAHYHAATEGIAAAADALAVLDEPLPRGEAERAATAGRDVPAEPRSGADRAAMTSTGPATAALAPAVAVTASAREADDLLALEEVAVRRGDRWLPPVSFSAAAGAITVLRGPSGAGKSSLVAALLGFAEARGHARWSGERVDLARGDLRDRIAWSGQRAALFPGTVADNVALGCPDALRDPALVARALATAGAGDLDPGLVVDRSGGGLSGGQAQRVGVARAVHRALAQDRPIVLLDEPTSAVDEQTEQAMLVGLRELASTGRAVLVVSHRPALFAAADHVVTLEPAEVPA
jgi:ATP-binding cassette subfamily C protein CydD